MKNGIINLNTDRAKSLGFTSDKFHGYLWKEGNFIIISLIESIKEGRGYLTALFDTIESKGYCVVIPNPLDRLKAICRNRGMELTRIRYHGRPSWAMVNKKDFKTKLKK